MILKPKFWHNKKVLVTGCTGFSGSWLVIFLHLLKSKIIGYSLKAPSKPNLFNILDLKNKIKLYDADINNYNNLKKIIYMEENSKYIGSNNTSTQLHKDINSFKDNLFVKKTFLLRIGKVLDHLFLRDSAQNSCLFFPPIKTI